MSDFEQAIKRVGEIHLNAKIDALQGLLKEIKAEGYTEIYQVEGHINSSLDVLDRVKGEQYEADAKADHVTEQIPNV